MITRKYSTVPSLGGKGILELSIACQFLHFAKTEDIGLKSALEGERDLLLITEKGINDLAIILKSR